MRRRLMLVLGGSVVAAAQVVFAGSASANIPKPPKPTVTAHGHVACRMNGTVKYRPALKRAAVPTSIAVKASLSCSIGTTGNSLVTVKSGKLLGSSTSYSGSCATPNPKQLTASIVWKPSYGKVNPTTVVFGAPVGGGGFIAHRFSNGLVAGSYAGERPTASFNSIVSSTSCPKKGIKGWSFSGQTFDINIVGCDKNIPTSWGVGQVDDVTRADNGHVWFVVVPAYRYTQMCHPTGTITWSYDTGANPLCRGAVNAPLADSGYNTVTSYTSRTGLAFNPEGHYFGVDTGINLARDGDPLCNQFHIHYSGDSVYKPFTM